VSSHLRHCPKHGKPLPCPHCVLAAKPAQASAVAVLEPEPVVSVPKTVTVAPGLVCAACGKPSKTELCKRAECVTGRTKQERQDNQEYESRVEKSERDKIARELRTIGQRVESRTSKKSDTKSIAMPVIPSADPAAPYGRDENNRPILPGRTDQQIATDLMDKPLGATRQGPCDCNLGSCRHCHPENIVVPAWLTDKTKPDLLSTLILRLNLQRDDLKTKFETELQKQKFVSYVDALKIDRTDLIRLLEVPAGMKSRSVAEKVLKSTSSVERRIQRLKKIIQKSEEYIESWSVHKMKLRRPDNILDKQTREAFKRKERSRIERCQHKITDLKRRLKTWADDPSNYERVLKTVKSPETLRERLDTRMLIERDPAQFEDDNEVCSTDRYLELFSNITPLPKQETWRKWEEFENEIVIEAIKCGLIVTHEILPENTNSFVHDIDEPEQDDPENALILKTGGAQVGATIYSGGQRNQNARPLESFDKRRPSGAPGEPSEHGGERQDNFYGEMDSGDLDERRGDE
jgi:hypothetical protein